MLRGARRKHLRGFTLMELMISITLVAAIATGMLMAMRGGLLTLGRTQTRLEENRRALGIQRILTLQLGGAMPVRTGCGGPISGFAFRGTNSVLAMVSTYSITEGSRGAPHIVEYQVAPDEGGTVQLIVNERLYTPAGTAGFCSTDVALQGSPQPLVAASRLAYCRISYFQMNPDTQFRGGAWVDSWNQPDLPGSVRILMAPAAPDPSRLPVVDVTAPLHINRSFEDLHYDDQQ
ncbi:MAG: prepilin-type N-terminal cleavage/methylation domain-containing protein [Acidobacteriia bacterium]|nr:prepilin-type N-terminal cleavage/methylation domain-containing protein [Terriglobia bacterium]